MAKGPLDITNPPNGDFSGGGGASTIADGANTVEGSTTDSANTTGAAGTISGKLRGLVTILANVWDSVGAQLKVTLNTRIAGEDLTNDVQKVEQRFNPIRVTADGLAKNGAGMLHTITVAPTGATVTAGVLTVYDSPTETGTVLFSEYVPASLVPHSVMLNVAVSNGVYIGFDATLAGVNVVASVR